MTSAHFACAVVDRIVELGVCVFCDEFDKVLVERKVHSADCPAGEYERTNSLAARRYLRRVEREARAAARAKEGGP